MSAVPSNVETLRQPPWSLEAEQSVLGGLLLVPEAFAQVADWLTVEDFYRREHRAIYAAIRTLMDRREPVDAVTLLQRLEADASRDQMPTAYLYELMNNTPGAANITAYAEIVVEQSKLRKLIEIGTQLAGKGFDRGNASELAIADAMRQLSQMQTSRLRGGLRSSRELTREWFEDLSAIYQRGDAITGLSTPWPALDGLTHGLQAGDLIIIAARPNMGKSVMAVQLAAYVAAVLNLQVALFSLEMTAKQVLNRAAAGMGNIPHKWLLSPHEDETYWPRLADIGTKLNQVPLWIDDTHGLTIDQIKARARRMHLRSKVGLLMVDHLHEIKLLGHTSSERAHELGEVAGELKGLGKDFDCPVIALAQLNRELLNRNDKHPIMSDLRASGDIEQVADLIIFLHREDYYDKKTHLKGVVDVEIGKGRNIPSFERIQLANRFDVMRLDNWEGELPLPPARPQSTSKKRNSFVPDPVAEAYAE
jgi:replicative DNA helicase